MKKLIEWVKNSLEEVEGKASSKRLASLACLIFMLCSAVGDQFFGYKPSEFVFESFMYIVCASIFGAGAVSIFKGKAQ
jgi:hypothetical protein